MTEIEYVLPDLPSDPEPGPVVGVITRALERLGGDLDYLAIADVSHRGSAPA
jgi:hypothetical protein